MRKTIRCRFVKAICSLAIGAAAFVLGISGHAAGKGLRLTTDGNSVKLYYGVAKKEAKGYVYIPVSLKTADQSLGLKKGYYFFDAKGNLSLKNKPSGKAQNVLVLTGAGNAKTRKIILCKAKGTATASSSKNVISPNISTFSGKSNNIIYADGRILQKGYALENQKLYKVSKGKLTAKASGVITSSFVKVSSSSLGSIIGSYYSNGTPATNVVNNQYYENGVPFTGTKWVKIGKNIYYIENGQAVTGWRYLPSYSGGTMKYKYCFKKNGVLNTNLFATNYKKYIKVPMTIDVNIRTHTVTFLMYNKATKKYDIPLKSCVCATSRKKLITGNYRLEKTSAERWFIYKKSKPWHYYQWKVHIKGTAVNFHSSQYYTTNNRRLNAGIYNLLGTSCTTYCVRVQAVNAKLIYDISTKTYKKARVWVKMHINKNNGPFGQVTLEDTTGKVKKSQRYDPTDPMIKKKK